MSSSTSRHRRGHAPKDSGISMRTKPEPDAAPTPPPSSSSSKQGFFICNRCVQPRAIHRRLPYQKTNLQLCDYCYQPKSLLEVRDASIIFEMKYCRQGGHEAPAINFKDDDNWSCCHCANRIASHPLKMPPERPLRVRPDPEPDLDYSRGGKGAAAMAAASGLGMMQQQHYHPQPVPDQRRQQEERPQIQYYSGSYRPRGHFENSSRAPKNLQTYHPQVRPPNMKNYIIKPQTSAPLQRLDPNTELKVRSQPQPQPQPQPKMRTVHGSRTYHEVPHPYQETPPKARQRPSIISHVPLSTPSHSPRSASTAEAAATPAAAAIASQAPTSQNPIRQTPAGPAWEARMRREEAQNQKYKRRINNGLRAPAATEEEERARADSSTLGKHTTCPCCRKYRPTYSELIDAYGFCFHCLRQHLVEAGELLKCPSCRRLQTRQDFMKYDRDGLVVERRTAECLGCQWRHKKGAKLSAALCGGLT
ncbi:hypothetical protein PG984_000721 [Apiospora sp. TS-2023a]